MGNSVSEREEKETEFGERIYEIVHEFYPESSENITGMLLEADYNDLERLLTTTAREELVARIQIAAKNLDTSCERENCELSEGKDHGVNHTNERSSDLHGGHLYIQECPENRRISHSGVSTDQNGTYTSNKQALGEILYSLIENQHPDDAEKVTGILLEMDFQSLDNLMKDPDLLETKVKDILAILENTSETIHNGQSEVVLKQHCDKSVIGEQLYELVLEFNTEQADKITGMLLEMDLQDLEVLVGDQAALEEKVTAALRALNNQTTKPVSTSLPEQETEKTVLGERLYYLISEWYPEQADKITGMLLELDSITLNTLLEDSGALKVKASLAANTLSETNTGKAIPCNSEEKNKISDSGTRHSLGKQRYNVIKKWYPQKAEKLAIKLTDSEEVDSSHLSTLVLNEHLLKEKIERMLDEKHETQTATIPKRESTASSNGEGITKEELGGQLYEIIEESHPTDADKITGMLLEMSVPDIENLLKNPQDLEEKIQLAEKALVHM